MKSLVYVLHRLPSPIFRSRQRLVHRLRLKTGDVPDLAHTWTRVRPDFESNNVKH